LNELRMRTIYKSPANHHAGNNKKAGAYYAGLCEVSANADLAGFDEDSQRWE